MLHPNLVAHLSVDFEIERVGVFRYNLGDHFVDRLVEGCVTVVDEMLHECVDLLCKFLIREFECVED